MAKQEQPKPEAPKKEEPTEEREPLKGLDDVTRREIEKGVQELRHARRAHTRASKRTATLVDEHRAALAEEAKASEQLRLIRDRLKNLVEAE